MERQTWFNLWYVIFAVLGVLWLRDIYVTATQVKPVPYSEFEKELKAGEIKDIAISNNVIQGTYKNPRPDNHTRFVTTRVDPDLAKELSQYNVEYSGVIESTFLRDILSWVAPALVFFAIWMFLAKRMAGQGGLGGSFLSIGKSKAKVYVETDTKVTFEDVAGVDEAKEELKEVVGFLKDPQRYTRLGGHIPKGVLLIGPPGTGKTLLARAVAGEAGVPFFSINGSEFVEMFVGVGAARVRDLFEQARTRAPAIVFIDEIDALGARRGYGGFAGNDEREQTLNQLLAEMDGFEQSDSVVVLAATNRPDALDAALRRPGRFDREVLVPLPNRAERRAILASHSRGKAPGPDVDFDQIAAATPGFSGADLANLVNEAALSAVRSGRTTLTAADFTAARDRVLLGTRDRTVTLTLDELATVAVHEAGHALVAALSPHADPVSRVTVLGAGHALGLTELLPADDRRLYGESYLADTLAVKLGGRAAERLVSGEAST